MMELAFLVRRLGAVWDDYGSGMFTGCKRSGVTIWTGEL